jgi:hypothetical protein
MPQVDKIFMFLYSETLVITDTAVITSFNHICLIMSTWSKECGWTVSLHLLNVPDWHLNKITVISESLSYTNL